MDALGLGVFVMSEKHVALDTRLTPVNVGLIVFATILAGAFAGWAANEYLPDYQLTEATRTLVSVSMAVVATISALVLGLARRTVAASVEPCPFPAHIGAASGRVAVCPLIAQSLRQRA